MEGGLDQGTKVMAFPVTEVAQVGYQPRDVVVIRIGDSGVINHHVASSFGYAAQELLAADGQLLGVERVRKVFS